MLRKGAGGEGLREMDLRVWSPCGWSLWSLPVATEIPRVSLRTDFGWLKNQVLGSEGGTDGTQDLGPQAVRDPGVGSVGWLMSAKGLASVGVAGRPGQLWG